MDWLDLLAVQGTLKSLLQHHSSKASVLQCSAFFMGQLSYPYITAGKTIALTRQMFVGKVMSLLFNMLSNMLSSFHNFSSKEQASFNFTQSCSLLPHSNYSLEARRQGLPWGPGAKAPHPQCRGRGFNPFLGN